MSEKETKKLSPSGQEALHRVMKIVNVFLARPDSGPFREPVDWRGLELYDYPEIIKKQMDLGTVKRKLERMQYANAAMCAHDIRLVWKNCMTYNAVGSDFWLLAKGYSKRFEDRYRRIRNEYDVGEEPVYSDEEEEEDEASSEQEQVEDEQDEDQDDEDEEEEFDGKSEVSSARGSPAEAGKKRASTPPPPKLDARAKFAANLLLLSGVHLGHIIQTLEKNCPDALESGPKLQIPEKLEIDIDKITPAEVFHTVSQYAAEHAVRKRAAVTPKTKDVSNKRAKAK